MGDARGAFTGADRDRKGLFREATEGTILDEIGEMPQRMQAGLLRVLQEKVARPSRERARRARGHARSRPRTATWAAWSDSVFREDPHHRLNVILVRVPPLRERLDDVPVLYRIISLGSSRRGHSGSAAACRARP